MPFLRMARENAGEMAASLRGGLRLVWGGIPGDRTINAFPLIACPIAGEEMLQHSTFIV